MAELEYGELRVSFFIKECDEEAVECGLEVSISSSTNSDRLQFSGKLFWEVNLGDFYGLQEKLESLLGGKKTCEELR